MENVIKAMGHELIQISIVDHILTYRTYKCKNCNNKLYAYPDENYGKFYYDEGRWHKRIISCEEMIIKKLLE